jgi:hypothetical protein
MIILNISVVLFIAALLTLVLGLVLGHLCWRLEPVYSALLFIAGVLFLLSSLLSIVYLAQPREYLITVVQEVGE